MNDNLLFRRQFYLGKYGLGKFNNWRELKINDDYYLYSHPDLEVCESVSRRDGTSLTLIGFMIDPYEPELNNRQIIDKVVSCSNMFDDVIKNTYHLGGRWAIIFNDGTSLKIFNDPCSMRQVYYTKIGAEVYCGSQPSILKEILNLEYDSSSEIQKFISSDQYQMSESAWIGDGSIVSGVRHLLPNHYLDLLSFKSVRFWIDNEVTERSIDEIIDEVSVLLSGTIAGICNRGKTILPVTAGGDSRVLLAASKDYKDQIQYYVSTHNVLKKNHMDIKIPQKLSEKLDLNFEIIDNLEPLTDNFRSVLQTNITQARFLSKTLPIQYFLKYKNEQVYNINGNASEIVKSFFGISHPEFVTLDYILRVIGYKSDQYVKEEVGKWLAESYEFSKSENIPIMDLFYWEQRMGNWGTMYQAEQDIAIEEISPFNNRKLLMMIMGVDPELRIEPDYILYQMIAKNLWEDTITEPINPLGAKDVIKNNIKKLISESTKTKIKKILKH